MPTQMKHETLVHRREQLKGIDLQRFFAFKKTRYALFRVQNFLEGGSAPEGEHMEIANKLEAEVKPYGGLVEFAKRWDIDPLTDAIVLRDRSIWAAHEQFMQHAATQLNIGSPHQDTVQDQELRRIREDGRQSRL